MTEEAAQKFVSEVNGIEWSRCRITARCWSGNPEAETSKDSMITVNYNEL